MAATSIPLANSTTVIDHKKYLANHPTIKLTEQCSNSRHLKEIHAQMLRAGLFFDPFSASKLIQVSALSQSSSLQYAQKVFDQIPQPNIYSFNALIRAYASSQDPIYTLSMFIRLLHECGQEPNKYTYPFVIKASAKVANLRFGRGIHGMVVKTGFSSDVYVGNCLTHLYALSGCLDVATRNFLSMPDKDIVSWNSMINGLAQGDYVDEAIEFFYRMVREGMKPNDVTLVGVLSACGKKADLDLGRWLHSYIHENEIDSCLILDNAILDMYTKCGSMKDARNLFDKMIEKDVISWTTMLSGYAKLGDFNAARCLFDSLPTDSVPIKDIATWNALISAYEQSNNPKEAIAIFNELQLSKAAKPDEITLVSTLSACSQLGAMDLGGWIHVYIKKEGMKLNRFLTTALIDMYSKCGDLQKALEVFNSADKRDVYIWSAMIAGLAMHGRGKDAIELFLKMQEAQVKPSSVTFTNLLSACSHSGLVKEGKEFFLQMERVYKILPDMEHYACIVDILGRAGLLKDAMEVINRMPITPNTSVWGALLGACKLHNEVDLAELACNQIIKLEPRNHGAYVLLSNTYTSAGKWDKASELRKVMRKVGLKKEPGCSSIEGNGVVHEFLVGDSTHPMSKKIYLKLDEIGDRLKAAGYVSNKSQLLHLIEEEDKQENALYLHSERLAIAYGLIALGPSQPIRIVKNLRICEDCHSVAKLISKIYDREILLRDRYRFHRFKGGSCSCMGYW